MLFHFYVAACGLYIKRNFLKMSIADLIENIENEDILVNCIKYVIELGANVDEVTDNWTPLMLAIYHNKSKVIDLLLESGADTEFNGNKHKETALIFATSRYEEETVEKLLKAGADVNAIDYYGWSSLVHARRNGHEGIIKLLIEHGADVSFASKKLSYDSSTWHKF